MICWYSPALWRGEREDAPVSGANQSPFGRGVINEGASDVGIQHPSDGYNGESDDLSVYGLDPDGRDSEADQ